MLCVDRFAPGRKLFWKKKTKTKIQTRSKTQYENEKIFLENGLQIPLKKNNEIFS